MVTERSTGSDSQLFRLDFDSYLKDFGTFVTLVNYAETKDSMGRMITRVPTNTTIPADVQWATRADIMHLNIGDLQIGDAMVFCKVGVTINIEDEILYKDERYRVVEKIEDEEVQGKKVYQGFTMRVNKNV
jgi:hypothetical protein